MIKYCYVIISRNNQQQHLKLSCLQIIRDLMETCQIPCVYFIQVFVGPVIYQLLRKIQQEKGNNREFYHFVENNSKNNIQDVGSKFRRLCEEIIVGGALIKTKKILQYKQMNEKSDFIDYFERLKKSQIPGFPKSFSDLKYFSVEFIKNGRTQFMNNLDLFSKSKVGRIGGKYCQYILSKIINSLESATNPLFPLPQSNQNTNNTELDMRKLLKHGDIILTLPLIQQLLIGLNQINNFVRCKHFISLLLEFVVWGNVEVLWKICGNDVVDNIGKRVAEVNGEKGLEQGQNIYPQIKTEKKLKKQFYKEYLNFLQILAKCIKLSHFTIPKIQKIISLYEQLKNQQKFIFPSNDNTYNIQLSFLQNIKLNQQRNLKILSNLQSTKQQITILNNSKIHPLININKIIINCLQQLQKIPINVGQLKIKIQKFNQFKTIFYSSIDRINKNNCQGDMQEIQDILSSGLELTKNIEKLQHLHKKLKNHQIKFTIFCQKYSQLLKNFGQTKQVSKESLIILNQQSKLKLKQTRSSMPFILSEIHTPSISNRYSDIPSKNSGSLSSQSHIIEKNPSNKNSDILPKNTGEHIPNQISKSSINQPLAQKLPSQSKIKTIKQLQINCQQQKNLTQQKNIQIITKYHQINNQKNLQDIFHIQYETRKVVKKGGDEFNVPYKRITNINKFNQNNIIKEPQLSPLNNSYYNFGEITKNLTKLQFRDCFKANKQVNYILTNTENKIMLKKSINTSASQGKLLEQHEQYLISKLTKYTQNQKQSHKKSHPNHPLQQNNPSYKKINFFIESNMNQINYQNQKQSIKKQPSIQKSQFCCTPTSIKPISCFKSHDNQSKFEDIGKQGGFINQDYYPSFLDNLKARKICLKTKALLINNQLCEVGFMVRKMLQNNIKIFIYFTPFQELNNLSYSISNQPNLQIQCYYKSFNYCSANKQIKIQINVGLKNIPFSIPIMNFQFIKNKQKKNISFYLPITIHRFIRMQSLQKSTLQKFLQQPTSSIKQTKYFKINPNILNKKTLPQYFPNITTINSNIQQKIQKYITKCYFKNLSFIIFITFVGKNNMKIQGIDINSNDFMEYFMEEVQKIVQDEK